MTDHLSAFPIPAHIARSETGKPWPPHVGETASHHLLRRRARARVRELERYLQRMSFAVERAERGPWRWRVVRVK